jgi:hypothetical protein
MMSLMPKSPRYAETERKAAMLKIEEDIRNLRKLGQLP